MGWTNLARKHLFKITLCKGEAVDIGCGERAGGGGGAIAVLRLKEWVNKDDKDSRQRERDRIREIIYI